MPTEKCFVEISSITSIELISTSTRRDFVPQIDELSMSTSIRRRFDVDSVIHFSLGCNFASGASGRVISDHK